MKYERLPLPTALQLISEYPICPLLPSLGLGHSPSDLKKYITFRPAYIPVADITVYYLSVATFSWVRIRFTLFKMVNIIYRLSLPTALQLISEYPICPLLPSLGLGHSPSDFKKYITFRPAYIPVADISVYYLSVATFSWVRSLSCIWKKLFIVSPLPTALYLISEYPICPVLPSLVSSHYPSTFSWVRIRFTLFKMVNIIYRLSLPTALQLISEYPIYPLLPSLGLGHSPSDFKKYITFRPAYIPVADISVYYLSVATFSWVRSLSCIWKKLFIVSPLPTALYLISEYPICPVLPSLVSSHYPSTFSWVSRYLLLGQVTLLHLEKTIYRLTLAYSPLADIRVSYLSSTTFTGLGSLSLRWIRFTLFKMVNIIYRLSLPTALQLISKYPICPLLPSLGLGHSPSDFKKYITFRPAYIPVADISVYYLSVATFSWVRSLSCIWKKLFIVSPLPTALYLISEYPICPVLPSLVSSHYPSTFSWVRIRFTLFKMVNIIYRLSLPTALQLISEYPICPLLPSLGLGHSPSDFKKYITFRPAYIPVADISVYYLSVATFSWVRSLSCIWKKLFIVSPLPTALYLISEYPICPVLPSLVSSHYPSTFSWVRSLSCIW
ncbi:hypothetical protein J6590_087775 [Homalodisca vitripennis]|nr:hypothetical protein J6590_087775 [Homalodisca vitripennis]